jgi:hypothetical protein
MNKSHSRRPLAALSLLASLAFAACQGDRNPMGIQPALSARTERAGAAANLNAHGLAYASAEDPYVCFTSVATGGTPAYQYGRISLHFPTPALAANGATHLYIYGGRNLAGQVVFVAECAIPATRTAVDWMNRRFGVVDRAGDPLPVGHAPRPGDGVSTMGCVTDGQCSLEGVTVTVSPLPVDNCNVMGCSTEGGSIEGGGGGFDGGGSTGGGSSDPGSPVDNDSTEVSTNCPSVLTGKVITALIGISGTSHEFRFEGPMTRSGTAASPAHYTVKPTVSTDGQWIAESGWVSVDCFGAYSPTLFGTRLWLGTASFAGDADLHMIYGPQHPSFF